MASKALPLNLNCLTKNIEVVSTVVFVEENVV